jgi:NADH-quinone oxidoreductase subunit I
MEPAQAPPTVTETPVDRAIRGATDRRTVRVKVVSRPEMSFWERIYVVEVIRGLALTAAHFFRNLGTHIANQFRKEHERGETVTFQYPEDRRPQSPRLRARHRIMYREDGTPRCVACMLCETACPDDCIRIVAEESPRPDVEKQPKSFEIDILRCCFCGLCVLACPEDAIRMDTGVLELTEGHRDIIFDKRNLLLLGAPLDTTRKGMTVPAE